VSPGFAAAIALAFVLATVAALNVFTLEPTTLELQ
jgi:hypothetical protein